MKKDQFLETLTDKNACKEAVEWAKDFDTWNEGWQQCKRGDWMLWIIGKYAGKPFSEERKPLVLAACECARLALKFVENGELRPLKAIKTAEAWAKGYGVTKNEIRNAASYAASYAADAASVASVASYAASYAADAAYDSAASVASDSAASYAADAAYDSAASYAADAAYYAASDSAASYASVKTLKECAIIVRKHFPDFVPSEIYKND